MNFSINRFLFRIFHRNLRSNEKNVQKKNVCSDFDENIFAYVSDSKKIRKKYLRKRKLRKKRLKKFCVRGAPPCLSSCR